MTAAHIAIQWQNIPMLEALIFHGADLLICDCNGQNIQDYAFNVGNDQLFQLNLLNQAFYRHSSQRIMANNDSNISENEPIMINDTSQKSIVINDSDTVTVVKEEDVELVEQRFESVSSPLNLDISNESSTSTESTASTIDEFIVKLNDAQLRQELNRVGFEICGPLNAQTRRCYQRKFHTLRKEQKQHQTDPDSEIKVPEENGEILTKMANYNIEFDSIRYRKFPFVEAQRYEMQLIEQFSLSVNNTNSELSTLRNGRKKLTIKSDQTYFVYLLLDPSITKNLPAQVNLLLRTCDQTLNDDSTEQFSTVINDYRLFYQFISSIFYVGKGKNDRPYQHFIDAHRERIEPKKLDIQPKIRRIWSIWDRGLGPISLHDCQGITSDEAQTREALIIETLGLFNLTNQIAGTYRQQLRLNQRQKSLLGTYLLYKFFIMYLLAGERQIRNP
ncbi:hypothetical protein BLA29_002589 [Euroglyphus maynei]|uniref:LEM domain-containing protein n=1 Tax=Euroglyphus maynei TaxID=6958 RepID=A0A1Y3B7C6_EURMA|nr:hypothetical protein BLA29_002589 [Euroglyphus maynei]